MRRGKKGDSCSPTMSAETTPGERSKSRSQFRVGPHQVTQRGGLCQPIRMEPDLARGAGRGSLGKRLPSFPKPFLGGGDRGADFQPAPGHWALGPLGESGDWTAGQLSPAPLLPFARQSLPPPLLFPSSLSPLVVKQIFWGAELPGSLCINAKAWRYLAAESSGLGRRWA